MENMQSGNINAIFALHRPFGGLFCFGFFNDIAQAAAEANFLLSLEEATS